MKYVNERIGSLLTAIFCLALTVSAAERTDFKVSNDGGRAPQSYPRIAVATDGSFAITWFDRRNGSADIYLQRFDADGNAIGQNRKVNDGLNDAFQSSPAIAADWADNYSLVWTDYRDGSYPFDPNIYLQRFDAQLNPISVNSSMTGNAAPAARETPDIALYGWGGGVIVWADYRLGNWDIFGQLIDIDGASVGGNFKINDDISSTQQHAPRVSVSPEGWFVVAWYDNRWGDDDIFAQRLDSDGTPLGANVRINSNAAGTRQAFPDVATDAAGHFTVVWVDWRNGTYPANPDIYACRFDTSMTAVTSNLKINTDNSSSAQREASIAADRMGNVAIIWSDSTSSSWDITGQMIDVEGIVQEANFRANSFGDSLQLHPDVALDGIFRYITWADNRNGNLDIYASISRYNEIALFASPAAVTFEHIPGRPLPIPVEVIIKHGGYNPIQFQITGGEQWLTVSHLSGLTPDTIVLSIATDTLPLGSYTAQLHVTGVDQPELSASIAVQFNVSRPALQLSTDSLQLTGFAGITNSPGKSVTVTNSGGNELVWKVTELPSWLVISADSGIAPSVIDVSIDAYSLDTGSYFGGLVFSAVDADNSPDTIQITATILPSLPLIEVLPDSIFLTLVNDQQPSDFTLKVNNGGGGQLYWRVQSPTGWISVVPPSGSDSDSIVVTVDRSLFQVGLNFGSIQISDSLATNSPVTIPVVAEYIERPVLFSSEEFIQITSTSPEAVDTFLIIRNIGYGNLNWQASAADNWLQVTPATGSDNDSLFLSIADLTLNPGIYTTYVDIADSNAINATVRVNIELRLVNQPVIQLDPDSIFIESTGGSQIDTFAIVRNLGVGNLSWQAISSEPWLNVLTPLGTDDDSLFLQLIDTGLADGLYLSIVTVSDSTALYPTEQISVVLQIGEEIPNNSPVPIDTAIIQSVSISPFQSGSFEITLSLQTLATQIMLPLEYQPSAIRIDSVSFDDNYLNGSVTNYQIDSVQGILTVSAVAGAIGQFLPIGNSQLCQVWFTAGEISSPTLIDVYDSITLYPYLLTAQEDTLRISVLAGTISFNQSEDPDPAGGQKPVAFELSQNYPNPFNQSTVIEFEVSNTADVKLEVFNILGQHVSELVSRTLTPGHYEISWNGLYATGNPVPTGIYFYRLKTSRVSLVRKMVLLK